MSSLSLIQSAAPSSNVLWAGSLSFAAGAATPITAAILDGTAAGNVNVVARVASSLAGATVLAQLNLLDLTNLASIQLTLPLSNGVQVVAEQVGAVGATLLVAKGAQALTLTPSAASVWDVQILRLQYQP